MERLKRAMEKARASAGVSAGSSANVAAGQTQTRPGKRFALPRTTGVARLEIKRIPVDPTTLVRHRLIACNKDDPRTPAFDMLRAQVLREMRDNGFHTLAVTSPTAGCGKTTVAINLALSIAQQSEPKVLLGDLDFRRPKIGEYLGLRPERDLSDYILEDAPLQEALVDPAIPGLLLLPNTKVHRKAAEMLTSPRMKSLVGALTTEDDNRVNIFDLPPMLATDDTIAFLPQVDCVLLVVADGSTKKHELVETLRLLEGATLLGVVLNKSGAAPRPY